MEPVDALIQERAQMDGPLMDIRKAEYDAPAVEMLRQYVDKTLAKVDELEQKVNEVEQFYSSSNKKQPNSSKCGSVVKDREKPIPSIKRQQQDAARREAASAKRMQELMRQFSTILRQITQHKWAGPFLEPVDVEGLGLHDYYEVIEKPMDFSTIKNKMEAKDGSAYKNVREIYADVRLVFKNAMTYNDESDDVHVMAKTLLAKFEEKWLKLLPKVIEEETWRKEEEAEALSNMQLAQEAAHAKMARDASNELCEVDMHLEELREMVIQKCRKMSTEEKKKLCSGLSRLDPEDLNKALEIIAKKNPSFQATAEEVELDMDAQSESTLWRLKFFVKGALESSGKSSVSMGGNDYSKRKREICDARAKTEKKRGKKLSS
ncbi:transcription factor GTE6-like [Macadamia integrifolia]|uniref:transcription factor GTE6-like n=1 Tax=Macadamia integrifolia TaxID=60698 RepID=UPI001C4F6D0D|nr:transcription factor GTE6-like [Macadamia integrifolia]XP_042495442.1 transcription factor GTE6-like [Macadamia integrifolia]XP_042495443.1 transcription factor GTE6-like [Macadamia integrifolia]XP_042495444.1 transcription factor GTE6-like [Macadamia integrifolia]XP_042495445.1 transcription factor GTE6-like [Macadamia integrifolia]